MVDDRLRRPVLGRWRASYRYTVLNRPVPDPFLRPHRLARGRAARPRRACAWRATRSSASTTSRRSAGGPSRCPAPTTAPSLVRAGPLGPRGSDPGDGVLRFEIEANAFCHQMVRSIVGTAGRGRAGAGAGPATIAGHPRGPGPPRRRPTSPRPTASCLWEVGLRLSRASRGRVCRRTRRASYRWSVASRAPARVAGVADGSRVRRRESCSRAHVLPESQRDRARLARRRRRGPGPRPHGHRGRPHPARQAQADVHAAPRHRRPRHHHQRRQGRAHVGQGREARWSTATPATRAASRTPTYAELLATKPEEAVRRTDPGHAPEEPPRPPDAHASSRSTPARRIPTPPSSPQPLAIDHARARAERRRRRPDHVQAPRPDHRPPQARRRPRPPPPRHRQDHDQQARRSRTTSRPTRTA